MQGIPLHGPLVAHAIEGVVPWWNVEARVYEAWTIVLGPDGWPIAGRELEPRRQGHNLVVTAGRSQIAKRLSDPTITGGVSVNPITHFAIGTSATAVVNTQTALVAQVLRDSVTRFIVDTAKLTVQYFLGPNVLNGNTLREIGLFNANVAGDMHARHVLASEIVKTSSKAVAFNWELRWMAADILDLQNVPLGGSDAEFVTGSAYPAGGSPTDPSKCMPNTGVWIVPSSLGDATFALEATVRVNNGTATPRICLVNLTDAPDVALAGSEVAGIAGNQTGNRVRSGAITLPAAGKAVGIKGKTDEAAGRIWAWNARLVRIS